MAIELDGKKDGKKKSKASDFLMWVGAINYPTVDSYIEEALRMGVCRRMGKLPKNLKPGRSRIFLAHDDGIVGEGFIFGYFVPDKIEYLAAEEGLVPDSVYDRVEWVAEWDNEQERECGYRHEGMYMVARFDEDEQELKPEKFVVFPKPRSLDAFDPERKHFRGLLEIEYGDKLMKARKAQCVVPPSRQSHPPVENDVPWTPEEDEAIMAIPEDLPLAKAAQILSYKTGRPKNSIIYRYKRLMKTEEGNEETETSEE